VRLLEGHDVRRSRKSTLRSLHRNGRTDSTGLEASQPACSLSLVLSDGRDDAEGVLQRSVRRSSPVVASADGTSLVPYVGAPLTVGNELNKLASNIAVGRDASGVHWRSDGAEGMAIGEAAAIAVLQDLRHCYNENFDGFSFTRLDGTPITI
jgi:hypothetical protein